MPSNKKPVQENNEKRKVNEKKKEGKDEEIRNMKIFVQRIGHSYVAAVNNLKRIMVWLA